MIAMKRRQRRTVSPLVVGLIDAHILQAGTLIEGHAR